MRQLGLGWRAIAAEMGFPMYAVRSHVEPGFNKRHVERVAEWRAKNHTYVAHKPEPRAVVPQDVLFERERAMLAPRSLTASIMGDPPSGRSALDRRRA